MVLRENYLRWSYKVKFTEFKVVNVLAVCTMPFEIRLPEFTKSNRPLASYEPELHPAALYRIKDIKATLQVFSTGSITVTDTMRCFNFGKHGHQRETRLRQDRRREMLVGVAKDVSEQGEGLHVPDPEPSQNVAELCKLRSQ
ncbi:TATA box-binding protein-like protein 1 [Acipenser ruthenus]|uniref:TATA box-binding protein-like protein 1 n=1 Tax=Acipenser ruthenus TaxID=7906 RepID=A0A444UFW7_ACIRT|nr:TATA box-binding protein-like protein 1 [Acipenser ruthenus]